MSRSDANQAIKGGAMRLSLPIILFLGLLNIFQLVKARDDVDVKTIADQQPVCCDQMELELMKAQDEILVLKALLNAYREANVRYLRLTAYTARPEETNEDVKRTAVMKIPVPGLTAAVSRDLKGWLGKRVYVKGFGVRLVSDLMHPRHSRSIDLLVEDVSAATEIGVQHDVVVTLIEPLGVLDTDIDLSELVEKILE